MISGPSGESPVCRESRRRASRAGSRGRAFFARTACGLLALLFTASCATIDPVTGKRVRNLWTLEDDIRLGADLHKDILRWAREEEIPIDRDAERLEQLNRIMRNIAAVSHLPGLPYEVTLLESEMVNAYALPGGRFVVFSGLYDENDGLVRDEDELAFVMAHEVAHVNCRHSTRAMTRALPVQLLLLGGALYAEHKGSEDWEAVLGGAFVVYSGLVAPNYSRKAEREADRVGLMYMARAGYDPEAAIRLWERASAEEARLLRSLSFLSTHPSSRDRARRLRRLLPAARAAYEETRAASLASAPGEPIRPGPSLRDEPGPRWSRIRDPEPALVAPTRSP